LKREREKLEFSSREEYIYVRVTQREAERGERGTAESPLSRLREKEVSRMGLNGLGPTSPGLAGLGIEDIRPQALRPQASLRRLIRLKTITTI
jgi:hypothetical protein